MLENFVPTYESTVTSNLWRDGAVLLGKTSNDEFAMNSENGQAVRAGFVRFKRNQRRRAARISDASCGCTVIAPAAS